MDPLQVDWLTVGVAAVLNMIIHFVWYSKWLFGPVWIKLSELKEKDIKKTKSSFFFGFLVSLFIAYFLAFFEGHLGVASVSDGMFIGFLLWLGFIATTEISSVIWCKKPSKLFVLHTSCRLLSFLVMSGVIGA
jgi:hypothetical protein